MNHCNVAKPRTRDTWWLSGQKSIPIFFGFEYKGLVFCRNNDCLMENMDKKPTAPKWMLINLPKIPQMPQKISAQFVCPSPKVWDYQKNLFECPQSMCKTILLMLRCPRLWQITMISYHIKENIFWYKLIQTTIELTKIGLLLRK